MTSITIGSIFLNLQSKARPRPGTAACDILRKKKRPCQALLFGLVMLALCGCRNTAGISNKVDWPAASDGFKWPTIEDGALVFKTLANEEVPEEVEKAAATLKSQYSPDYVTFARLDLNADGRFEILIKRHHYGFAPSYSILTLNEAGKYFEIGDVTGDEIFLSEKIDGWLQLQGRSADDDLRWLFAYVGEFYELRRSESLDHETNKVKILTPQT